MKKAFLAVSVLSVFLMIPTVSMAGVGISVQLGAVPYVGFYQYYSPPPPYYVGPGPVRMYRYYREGDRDCYWHHHHHWHDWHHWHHWHHHRDCDDRD